MNFQIQVCSPTTSPIENFPDSAPSTLPNSTVLQSASQSQRNTFSQTATIRPQGHLNPGGAAATGVITGAVAEERFKSKAIRCTNNKAILCTNNVKGFKNKMRRGPLPPPLPYNSRSDTTNNNLPAPSPFSFISTQQQQQQLFSGIGLQFSPLTSGELHADHLGQITISGAVNVDSRKRRRDEEEGSESVEVTLPPVQQPQQEGPQNKRVVFLNEAPRGSDISKTFRENVQRPTKLNLLQDAALQEGPFKPFVWGKGYYIPPVHRQSRTQQD